MTRTFSNLDALEACVGLDVARSGWVTLDQARIDAFAELTGDRQWIHLDAERCATESPYRTTIAHGFLTLSLLASMFGEAIALESARHVVNYGFERVRFLSPVVVGSSIRASFVLAALARNGQTARATWDVNVEIRDFAKPALAAVWISQIYE